MPSTRLRQTVIRQARTLVVKLGTQVLTAVDGTLDVGFIQQIARQVSELHARGLRVTLVSSGAVGAGMGQLGLQRRPDDLAALQALAAAGQPQLLAHYREAFATHGLGVGQVLLTRQDFEHRGRFINIRNCLNHLHEMGCVPIVNENDTVAVEELAFGDNDLLAAMIGHAVRADALVLLSVVDGLLDETGQRIDLVQHAGDARSLARDETSARGRGGMASKLEAVRRMTDAGEIAVIAHGREPDVLLRLLDGEPLGTVFTPAARKLSARRRWIGLTKRASGVLVVDDGAVRALTQRGKSLLAIGIREVQYLGPRGFERGDVLAIHDTTGREIGLGLTNYGLAELRRIQGQPSTQFSELLGRDPTAVLDEEVIHRDNLAITGEGLAVANQRS